MLIPPPSGKAFIKLEPVDFRKGIDSLVAYIEQVMGQAARCGSAFVFCNRQKTALKILYYDGSGYFLCHKRFSSGRMRNWPKHSNQLGQQTLSLQQLVVLIYDGSLDNVDFKEDFVRMSA